MWQCHSDAAQGLGRQTQPCLDLFSIVSHKKKIPKTFFPQQTSHFCLINKAAGNFPCLPHVLQGWRMEMEHPLHPGLNFLSWAVTSPNPASNSLFHGQPPSMVG